MSTRDARPQRVGLRDRNQQTARALIREAAHDAFLAQGYAGTTMSEVARAAGVARQTIYNLYESKAILLIDVIGHQVVFPTDRDQAADRHAVLSEPDARILLKRFAAAHRRVVERTVQIMRVALQAAAVDGAVTRRLEELEVGRRSAVGDVVEAIEARGSLRRDETVGQLRVGLALLAAPSVAVTAMDAGMTLDQYERWIADTAAGLLLAE